MILSGVFWGSAFPLRTKSKNKLAGLPLMAAMLGMGVTLVSTQSAMGATERRIAFYMVHTKETIDVVYKRNVNGFPGVHHVKRQTAFGCTHRVLRADDREAKAQHCGD